ncbi:hypothetical protein Glove_136g75 [Diversispora epigaea]|uniref:Serine-threonine/tyrosine-protein kinase catalytic domain-containing protein n=1 Tax=Diversispora epigaea TaxID=1348612 RepID=A0A397IZA1_9GLOM|nr:hypothetical protein Glove_136g75 [Diversispora epigaea]
MKQCWDANPDNRPHAVTIVCQMESLIRKSFYNEMEKQQEPNIHSSILKSEINTQLSGNTEYRIQNSKVFTFNIPIKPRNATNEEQTDEWEFGIASLSNLGSQFQP